MRIFGRVGFIVWGAVCLTAGPVAANFGYPDFSSIEGLNLVRDAAQVGNTLYLTSSVQEQIGAAWFAGPQRVSQGFETTFQFQIGDVTNGGADGLAFVVQLESVAALGGPGGAMGYGTNDYHPSTGISRSVAVEFDMWDNVLDWHDDGDNHISVNTRGMEPNHPSHDFSLGSTRLIPDMSDGSRHTARIDYAPGAMRVFLDDMSTSALTVAVDLADILELGEGDLAWVGFTSATSPGPWAWQSHAITSWSFTEIPEPVTLSLVAFGACLSLLRGSRRPRRTP